MNKPETPKLLNAPIRVTTPQTPAKEVYAYRASRRRIESSAEERENQESILGRAKYLLETPLKWPKEANRSPSYFTARSNKRMISLMERCREVFHEQLLQEAPKLRTRKEFEEQFMAAVPEGALPPEMVEYLLADKAYYFHSFPPQFGEQDPSLGFEEGDFPRIISESSVDPQACCACLRGSKDVNNQVIRTMFLHEESPWFSPSESFLGLQRRFLRAWTCSQECYYAVKGGLPLQQIEAAVSVEYPFGPLTPGNNYNNFF